MGKQSYDRFNAYLGEHLGHLEREQTDFQQAFWDHFTDEEAMAMEQAIEGSVPPERIGMYLREMCVSYNPDYILPILHGIKARAPLSFSAGCSGWLNRLCRRRTG